MAPVNGRPFIDHILHHLTNQGIEHIVLALGYGAPVVIEHIHTNHPHLNIHFSTETEPCGTGGAVLMALPLLKEKHICIVNGDTLFAADIQAAASLHIQRGAACSLLLKPMQQSSRYGLVEVAETFAVTAFREKQYAENALINAGFYLLDQTLFSHHSFPVKFSFEQLYLEKTYINNNIYGIVQDVYFIDIGVPEDYARAQTELQPLT